MTDYTTDRRGDIGSFIRIEAIKAVQIILKQTEDADESRPEHVDLFVGCLCRLAAEKLDKVRFQAWVCLQKYWGNASYLPPMERYRTSDPPGIFMVWRQTDIKYYRKFEHFSQVSSFNYFHQLLRLLQVESTRRAIMQGLITSASAGTEGLIQSSRFALIDFIENKGEDKCRWANILIGDLVAILEANLQDDRYAIPAMEIAAFLVDTYITEPAVHSDNPRLVITSPTYF